MATAVEIAAKRLEGADVAARAAKAVGVPLAIAFALVDMESEGRNIYGNDAGGTFAQTPRKLVTRENYAEFYDRVVNKKQKSNGVGPLQITWAGGTPHGGFHRQAKEQGLNLWDPYDNYLFGFTLLKGYLDRYPNDLVKVGRLYNGKESYGVTFKRIVGEWQERLKGASEEATTVSNWYPAATKREIKPGSNDPAIKPIGAILHVDAGNSASLFNYFNGPSGGIESHFHITKTGVVEQYRSVGYEADANYKANSFVEGGVRKGYVSIETQGLEAGEWTKDQLAAIKALLTWLHNEHGIPLRVPKHSKDPGVGYHTMWGAPGDWTPVAKSCPGPKRIKQYKDVLVPWFSGAEPAPAPKPPALVKLEPGVIPGKRHPQVILLKSLIIQLGLGAKIKDPTSNVYGAPLQAAIAAWHKANPKFSTGGYDTAIGPRGFQELQRQAAAKK